MGIFILLVGDMSGCVSNKSQGEAHSRVHRHQMVVEQLQARGIHDRAVLEAMGRIERHKFLPEGCGTSGYEDFASPIGFGQTISQPYIVALSLELCKVKMGDKVLEIGTGSGYQAAVIAELTNRPVFSLEIIPELAESARSVLNREGYATRVEVIAGDGFDGLDSEAPFDCIVVAAAPEFIPPKLKEQLNPKGGRLVIPVGPAGYQELLVLERSGNNYTERSVLPVRFVPLTGKAVHINP